MQWCCSTSVKGLHNDYWSIQKSPCSCSRLWHITLTEWLLSNNSKCYVLHILLTVCFQLSLIMKLFTVVSFRHNIEFCMSITRQFFGTLTMKSVKNVPIHYAIAICQSDHNVRTSELVRWCLWNLIWMHLTKTWWSMPIFDKNKQ